MEFSDNQHHDHHTLGFEEPAKPALMDDVPLSMTIGWLSNNPPAPVSEEDPPSAAEAELMMDDDRGVAVSDFSVCI
jgi:hypothetical protein